MRGTCECGARLGKRNRSGNCRACCEARPLPDDFAANAHRSAVWLKAHYRVSAERLARWFDEAGIKPAFVKPKAWTRTDDDYLRANFADVQHAAIAEQLGRSAQAVKTRCGVLGLRKAATGVRRGWGAQRAASSHSFDGSAERLAAEYVATHDRCPVYRIDVRGRPDPKGTLWRYGFGTATRTDAEIVAMAKRKGYDPDAWMRVAA